MTTLTAMDVTIQAAFDLGKKEGGAAYKQIHSMVIDLIVAGHAVDDVIVVMRKIDTKREIFDLPALPTEIGLHGLNLYSSRFEVCSNCYGDDFVGCKNKYPTKFFRACEKGFNNGTLHDYGNIVYDLRDDRFAFAIDVVLETNQRPVMADLEALEKKHGFTFEAFAEPHRPMMNSFPREASASVICLIHDPKDFPKVPSLFMEIHELMEQWTV